MSYQTTKEHEALRLKVRAFAEKEVKPVAFMNDQEAAFPVEQVKMLGEMGMLGIPFPEEYGGVGLDNISYAIVVEELSRVDGSTGVIVSAHTSLCAWPIYAYGTQEQKQKYLTPLASGKKIGAFGLTETNAGSDAGGTETTADPDGDYFILNGGKIFITNASYADIYVVTAVTNPELGIRGISAFILEKGQEGFTFGDTYDKLGIRASSTCELKFNNVRVHKSNMLGQLGEGFKIAMATLDGGRIGIAAQALGIAQGAFEAALTYSKERVQFDSPIAFNQAITFKLSDMATKLRASRLMIYSAAALKDEKQSYGMEAAMAKQYASDVGLEIVNDALQIHGGSGYMKGMLVERAYRDMKITTIYEGTNEILRVVIASSIVGRPPKKEVAAKAKTVTTGVTGVRKKIILEGTNQERVDKLVAALKSDGYDFTIGIDAQTPIPQSGRVVVAGKGIGSKESLVLLEKLAYQAGAAVGSTRPVAETLRYMPINRYIGMSGQKFVNNLYIGVGVSGAGQHLKGIKTASTIVAINNDPNALIFKNCDYGIVGDFAEIVPLLITALDNGETKRYVEQPKKIKRAVPKKLPASYKIYVCNGCAYEYDQKLGDPESDTMEGTPFEMLPFEWVCPECGEEKSQFI
ncbi:MAG: acyl-CoA dehydrogenase family protein [Oscillospiraceae bacterium]|nr:acyl-CoA dehydrogenase family protein [Oscillospiraceae bacterium]